MTRTYENARGIPTTACPTRGSLDTEVPLQLGLGGSPWAGLGYLPKGGGGHLEPVTEVPPQEGTWDQRLEVLWYPPLSVDRQTCVKTLPHPSFGCGR